MRGWYKAKESYKNIPEGEESYKMVSPRKHKALLNGDVIKLQTTPRLMGKDFIEHLEACDEPVKESPPEPEAPPEKSAEPSDEWTKDELKVYMDANSIDYNSGDTKADLLAKCSASDEGDE